MAASPPELTVIRPPELWGCRGAEGAPCNLLPGREDPGLLCGSCLCMLPSGVWGPP